MVAIALSTYFANSHFILGIVRDYLLNLHLATFPSVPTLRGIDDLSSIRQLVNVLSYWQAFAIIRIRAILVVAYLAVIVYVSGRDAHQKLYSARKKYAKLVSLTDS